ncbi:MULTISPECIES: urease accessory protein UreD [unclassified Streptomyces]|uniref:urease accessory protein UreD n=1 Tax=unclassified Streptomyces TaxID=2593676 RepID=UPI0022568141|nr:MULTISPECIES: urease accessory protein UreD [unclassified Streptomyces]MCX4794169.1 urease accessory protein UreD [Streptomyces sp. NBC_01242]WSP61995.1 urease accessory protein UreD [Streptomyces sp. NBC_01240]
MTLTTEATVPATERAATTGVRATARIAAATRGGTTTLPVLDGDGPFELRRLRSRGTEARVCVVGAMSAPLGGDRLRIEATAQQGAALHITSAAATLALRGPTPEPATYAVHLTVEDNAELHWLPKPLICAAGSNLRQTWTIDLAPTARLVLREEQILGRTGEASGCVTTRLTVRRDGSTLLDQQAAYGPGAPGWDGPAVLADHRATGQLLIVEPDFEHNPLEVQLIGDAPEDGQAVLTPLAGPAALVTAIAPDGNRLRHLLATAQGTPHRLGPPGSAPKRRRSGG